MTYAEKEVACYKSSKHGVSPGDKQRTPTACLKHYGKKDSKKSSSMPMIMHFGKDFKFELTRYGNDRQASCSQYGLELATIMYWLEDQDTREEVCFIPDGREYMRYDRRFKTYNYPDGASASFEDLIGCEGRIQE